MSRSLATIVTDLDIPCELDDFRYDRPQKSRLLELYQELEFNTFARELGMVEEETELVVRDFREVLEEVEPGDALAIFLMTDPHHPMWAQVVDTYFWWQDRAYVLSGRDTHLLKSLLEDEKIEKYLHNAKTAQVIWARQGIATGSNGDTLLLSYVVSFFPRGKSAGSPFSLPGKGGRTRSTPEKAVAEIINFTISY